MPTFVTVFNWRRTHPEFLEQYARAREDQADAHIEEVLDVARQAVKAKSSEEVQGYQLLVDTLKWRASKMKPRSYGDKLTLNAEVGVRKMTDEQLNARLAYLLGHRPGTVQGDPLAYTCHAIEPPVHPHLPLFLSAGNQPCPFNGHVLSGWRRACKTSCGAHHLPTALGPPDDGAVYQAGAPLEDVRAPTSWKPPTV